MSDIVEQRVRCFRRTDGQTIEGCDRIRFRSHGTCELVYRDDTFEVLPMHIAEAEAAVRRGVWVEVNDSSAQAMPENPAAEIERLRARVAELEETVRFSEDQRRMLFDAAKKLEADRDRLQSLANVYRTEVMARRNERAAFFSRTMKYEEWQAASRQVEIARADTDAARAANGEVGG